MDRFDLCKNCHYSIRMKNSWICGEYAATIEPYDKMCERGVKRYVGEVSMVQVDSEVQSVDMPTPVQVVPIS